MMDIAGRTLNRGDMLSSEIAKAYVKPFKVRWWHCFFGYGITLLSDESYRRVDLAKISNTLEKNRTENDAS